MTGIVDLIDIALEFLRDARHDGDREDLIRIYAQLLRDIGLGDRAEHLLRRFRGRKVFHHIRILCLHETQPTRTTGSKHRPFVTVAVCQSFEEFASLFHDRKVCAVIGIENIVDADLFERTDQLAHSSVFIFQTDLFAPCCTDRRSDLYHRDDLRIRQRVIELAAIVAFAQCADRTMRDALTAERTVAFLERLIIFETDRRPIAGTDQRPNTHTLHFFTDLDAPHALHTLGGVAHQRQISIPTAHFRGIGVIRHDDADIVRDRLQRTVSALGTARAVRVMVGKDQLNVDLSGPSDTRTVSQDLHAFFTDCVAGSHQFIHSFDLYKTDTTGADLVDIFQVT